jgi:hypothetical protein
VLSLGSHCSESILHYLAQLVEVEMVDRRAKTNEFRSAVKSRDPYALAKVLNIPSVSPVKGSEPKPPKESLQEGGTDWSSVLNAWLGACEAAEAVSCSFLNDLSLHSLDSFRTTFSSID